MDKSFFGYNSNRNLGTGVLILLIVALGAYTYYTLKQAAYLYMGPTTISVTGEGEVMAVPDIGQFNFSVTATGTDAAAAQGASAEKINDLVATLKAAGVEDRDIKTSNYSLYPKYRYEPCVAGRLCTGESKPDGFETAQTITVKVRDLNKAGQLLSAMGDKGATNISGLEFTIDDSDTLKDEARTKAIAEAKRKAKELAKELGVRLVDMTGYYEDEHSPMPRPYGAGRDSLMLKAPAIAYDTAEIPTGENTIKSRVTITYQVK